MDSTVLNINQRRRLEVTLYLIEPALDEMSLYLRGQLPRGAMYVTISDLSPDQSEELLRLIDETKRAIAEIKSQFGLEVRVNELRAMILGHLSSMWESLHNARPRNLSGFGAVSPQLFETLDPKLMALVHIMTSMSQLITSQSATGAASETQE
jgi:hypothetical protein